VDGTDTRRTDLPGFISGRHARRLMALFERPKPQMGTQDEVVLRRIGAFVVDAILVAILGGLLAGAFGLPTEFGGGLTGALLLLYFIVFEGTYGKTMGKHLLGLVVVTERGEPCEYADAAVRNVLRLVDVLPVFYIVGLVAIYHTDEQQRLGDLAADTVVVRAADRGERL
jgi:uncharacterized RDD family membrane protein YckC